MRTTRKTISIASIDAIDNNPNRMEPHKRDALLKLVRDRGFLQPILVGTNSGLRGRHMLIDGQHRLEVMHELERDKVDAVVVQDCDVATARMLRIALNNLRGELDLTSVASELLELRDTFTLDELTTLGYDERELARLLQHADRVEDDLPLSPIAGADEDALDRPRSFALTIRFDRESDRALARARLLEAAGADSLAQGLMRVLGEL